MLLYDYIIKFAFIVTSKIILGIAKVRVYIGGIRIALKHDDLEEAKKNVDAYVRQIERCTNNQVRKAYEVITGQECPF